MKIGAKHIIFSLSLLMFLAVVPYSIIEWFDKSIPYSPALYFISGFSILLLVANAYYLIKR
jgi:hypothetical protein